MRMYLAVCVGGVEGVSCNGCPVQMHSSVVHSFAIPFPPLPQCLLSSMRRSGAGDIIIWLRIRTQIACRRNFNLFLGVFP